MTSAGFLKISILEYLGIDGYEARLTLKQAAKLAGLRVEDFMRGLSRRKVSIINLDDEELKIAEKLVGKGS